MDAAEMQIFQSSIVHGHAWTTKRQPPAHHDRRERHPSPASQPALHYTFLLQIMWGKGSESEWVCAIRMWVEHSDLNGDRHCAYLLGLGLAHGRGKGSFGDHPGWIIQPVGF